MGIEISELVDHSIQRNSDKIMPYVDLWIAILDEFNSWLTSLHDVFYSTREKGSLFTDFEKSIFMLLSKIVGDTTAIRHLILLGFDTSARTILRSTAEYMEVLVAILHDPTFSKEFVTSDTPEKAKIFWEKHLRSKKIRKKIKAAWHDFFCEEKEIALWLADWGNNSMAQLSALLHPSFAGGLFTLIPLQAVYSDENWLGIWGEKSDMSVQTICIYTSFMFPILLLGREFPFTGFEQYMGYSITYDENDELHRHVKVGRDI